MALEEHIRISKELKDDLEKLRENEGHSSLDSVIRMLRNESDAYRIIKEKERKSILREKKLKEQIKKLRSKKKER